MASGLTTTSLSKKMSISPLASLDPRLRAAAGPILLSVEMPTTGMCATRSQLSSVEQSSTTMISMSLYVELRIDSMHFGSSSGWL